LEQLLIPNAAATKKTFFYTSSFFLNKQKKGRQASYRNMPKRNAKEMEKQQ